MLEYTVAGTALALDRPSAWWLGGLQGAGVMANFIGHPTGYPAFSVETDPDANIADPAASHRALDDLFDQIVSSREANEVVFADWITIDGLSVHSSLTTFPSVAGTIMTRRLLLVYRGQPYILGWTTRADDYGAIEELVEWCVGSLHLAVPAAATTVAD